MNKSFLLSRLFKFSGFLQRKFYFWPFEAKIWRKPVSSSWSRRLSRNVQYSLKTFTMTIFRLNPEIRCIFESSLGIFLSFIAAEEEKEEVFDLHRNVFFHFVWIAMLRKLSFDTDIQCFVFLLVLTAFAKFD